ASPDHRAGMRRDLHAGTREAGRGRPLRGASRLERQVPGDGGRSRLRAAPMKDENAMSIDRLPPLELRHNPMLGRHAMTMCCIARNESFFLDAFLAHYRALGVERFIVLDDRSTDGSLEFLAAEPDVMIVGSDLRYGEDIVYSAPLR